VAGMRGGIAGSSSERGGDAAEMTHASAVATDASATTFFREVYGAHTEGQDSAHCMLPYGPLQ